VLPTDRSTCWLWGGSGGVTFTATPTYQKGGIYLRSDLAWVHATSYTPGNVFGKTGTDADQFRGVLEFGFIFGKNISLEK